VSHLSFNEGDARLSVEHQLCQDTMTGMPYPYRAALMARDGQPLNGCGGSPYDLLQGPEWRLVSVQSRAVPDEADWSLLFSEQRRVSGKAACNRFSAPVRLSGEGFALGPLVQTKMACPAALMDWERAILSALAEADRFSVTEDGQLRLYRGGTPSLTARLRY
jgi:heat shock protein HslJ